MDIKYIGEYLSERFQTDSYWDGTRVPIRNNQELVSFVNSKRSKVKLHEWLSLILENDRSRQCIVDYRVRKVNKYGWNSVIEYLSSRVNDNSKLPAKKRMRRNTTC